MTTFFQSIRPTLNNAEITEMLDAAVTGLLGSNKVYLFTAGPNPIPPNAAFNAFTGATFAAYAPQALVWNDNNINLPSSDGIGRTGHVDFIAGAVSPPGEVILGYLVAAGTSPAGTQAFLAEYFPEPINVTAEGDLISIDVVLPVANQVQVQNV